MQNRTRKTNRGRVISTLLAVVLAAGLLVALPQTAFADSRIVSIAQSDSINEIQTKIQNAIDTSPAGSTITVIGSRIWVDSPIGIELKNDVHVIWRATYSGDYRSVIFGNFVPSLLTVDGNGCFEVAEGADICGGLSLATINVIGDNKEILVTGGFVHSVGCYTILIDSSGTQLTVSGGTVENEYGFTLFSTQKGSSVAVKGGQVNGYGSGLVGDTGLRCSTIYANQVIVASGGKVVAAGSGDAVKAVQSLEARVVIDGGTVTSCSGAAVYSRHTLVLPGSIVEATTTGNAIKSVGRSSEVEISGGMVCARSGYALLVDDYGTATIKGGFVFAHGVIDPGHIYPYSDVITMFAGDPDISGNAVICAWNQRARGIFYNANSSLDLTSNPQTGRNRVTWNVIGGVSGISYAGSPGFYAVDGVWVSKNLR